jgi:hypothetical protein
MNGNTSVDFGPNDSYTICRDGSLYSNIQHRFLSNPDPSTRMYVGNRLIMGPFDRHRLVAMHFVFNPRPDYLVFVDHIDRNRFNCQSSNLRWVTDAMNKLNTRSRGLSPYPGRRKPYKAVVQFQLVKHFLRYCETEDEAMGLQDRIREGLLTKLIHYERYPTTWGPPGTWRVTEAGVYT